MKLKKEYIVLAVLVVALSVYLIAHKQGRLHYKLPRLEQLKRKDITKLAVKNGVSEVTLQRKDGKWVILPEKFPADGSIADEMAEEISTLNLAALAGGAGFESVYGLGSSGAIAVSAYHGDKLLRSFEVGKPSSSGRLTFVKLRGDDRVYYARGNLRETFDKGTKDLRDKTVLSFHDRITGITIEEGRNREVFVKAPPKAIGKTGNGKKGATPKWLTAAGTKADGGKLDEIITTLSDLSCEGFVPSKTKKDFAHPTYIITLRGVEAYSLSLFRKEGDKYPALSSQSDYPFYLRNWQVETLLKDLDALWAARKETKPIKRGKGGHRV
ncbi:MAG: DUF4340 domain-containing protein [Candidatus Sulfobium sp.]